MWSVVVRNDKGETVVKQFPFKAQAIVWCYEQGLVYSCKYEEYLDPCVEIIKEDTERNI